MNKFAALIIRHRLIVLLLVLALTGWFGYRAASLQSDGNPMNIFPADDPDVIFSHETGERFGSNYINMVALQADDIFTHEALKTLQAMTKAVAQVPGVKEVISLANLLDMQPDGEGSISVRQLVDPAGPPTAPEELAKLRANVLGNSMLVGNLISPDGRVALMSVMLDKDADSSTVGGAIKQAATAAAPGQNVYFGGVEMIIDYLAAALASPRMIVVMGLMFALLLLVMYWGLGSARGLLIAMSVAVLAIVWTLGALAIFGFMLSMFTSMLPLLIFAVGSFFTIGLLVRYVIAQSAEQALAQQGTPMLAAGLIMSAVFFSLAFAPLDILRDLGIGLGIASLSTTILSLTFAPALLSLWAYKEPRRFALASPHSALAAKLLGGAVQSARRRKTILGVTVAVLIAAAALTFFVPRNANMMDNFPPCSEPRVTDDLLTANFGGSSLFMINFSAKDVRQPAILEQMELASKRMRNIEDVYFPQSVADVVTMLNRNLNNEPTVPDSMDKINNLWFMLEGQSQVAMLLENSYANGIVMGRIGSMDAAVVGRAIARLQQLVDETVSTELVSVAPAEFPAAQRKAFLKLLAERCAEKTALDYRFHTGKTLKNQKGLARALLTIRLDKVEISDADRQDLQARILTYLAGDGCDILLPEGFDSTPAAAALAALNDPDAAALIATLKQVIPESSWNDDPESLTYAAATIGETFSKTAKRFRLGKSLKAAEKALNIDLRTPRHAALKADLTGDLWALNNAHLGVEQAVYREIVGTDPPAEKSVSAQARLTGLPVVTAKLNDRLPATTAKALALGILLILVLSAVRFTSASTALIAALPAALTVLINFAAMTILGIALDNIIVVVQNIALAICAAYTMYLATALHREPTIAAALAGSGRAILIHTLAVGLGFAAMIFAALGTQALLGLFVTLSLLAANGAVFTILPALLAKPE